MRGMLAANLPEEDVLLSVTRGNTHYIVYQNPITKERREISIPLPFTATKSQTVEINKNTGQAVLTTWSGEPNKSSITKVEVENIEGYKVEPKEGPTSYQEWTLAGKPGTYAQFLKDRKDTEFFRPAPEEKSAVARWMRKQEDFDAADLDKLETDPNFFYWGLQNAIEAGMYVSPKQLPGE